MEAGESGGKKRKASSMEEAGGAAEAEAEFKVDGKVSVPNEFI